MKIYTKTGDGGTTGTLGQGRRSKDDLLFHVLGELDELNATLAICRINSQWRREESDLESPIFQIQCLLFALSSEIASLSNDVRYVVGNIENNIQQLENDIDVLDSALPALNNFIIPGGTVASCNLHLSRAVCRRAERGLVELQSREPSIRLESVKYLNRLSDWLFVQARIENHLAGIGDDIWIKKDD